MNKKRVLDPCCGVKSVCITAMWAIVEYTLAVGSGKDADNESGEL